jgi:hypothetical protein
MRSVGLLGDDQSITREGTPFARLPSPDPQVLSIAPEPVRDLGLEAEPVPDPGAVQFGGRGGDRTAAAWSS